MPRRKANSEDSPDQERSPSPPKRPQSEVVDSPDPGTPSKRRKGSDNSPAKDATNGGTPEITPTPKRRGRPPKKATSETPTPKTNRVLNFTTPTKTADSGVVTPGKQAAADRSAKKKSTRALIEQVVRDDEQDDDGLARGIYASSEDEDEDDDDGDNVSELRKGVEDANLDTTGDEAATPSKKSGRKARQKKQRSPTPPRDLPSHELYFAHNKPGRPKTSDNTLSSLALLTHEEYFNILREYKDPHTSDIEYLESLHAECFPQWIFEVSQGFGLCLYGYGSKRSLLHKFAKQLHLSNSSSKQNPHPIIMVNGYTHTTTIREILNTVKTAIDPDHRVPASQPAAMVQSILSHLTTLKKNITIIVNSIDASPLRKRASQVILSQLAAHPQITFICSADTPDFSLLWDIGIRSAYNFVFHDCTTFGHFAAELDAVDDVHDLLDRNSRRVNGREGVAFVLKSLPENAKNLFALLVGEMLISMEEEGGEEEEGVGVEYRIMYNRAVEEFICSSEMAFRTLLKE